MIALWIILGIIVILLIWAVTAYNKLVRFKLRSDEAFATMDVYLKQRFDLIPNLVETVKGYAKHEAETLEKVVSMRNAGVSGDSGERLENEAELTKGIRQIFALAENYPDLKANTNFQELMRKLTSLEADIANARKFFNAVVNQYNQATMVVPTNIIAGMFGFKQRALFEVDEAMERKNVKVEF